MTVARIIAITVVVCAAIGMTTQAEAAKRKSTNTVTFRGCAELDLLCGPVMKDTAGRRYAFVPSGLVTLGTPVKVVGRRSSNVGGGWCKATRVQVLSVTPTGGTCGVGAR